MGLKGYRLWVMGQLDSNVQSPTARANANRSVALQVAFERQILEPGFHLIGYRLWVCKAIGYGSCANLIPTCRAPPLLQPRQLRHRAVAVTRCI
jgi:hypothetical protein